MTADQGKIKKLKNLIFQSRSFGNEEKKQLVGQLPNLSQEEVNNAIEVFNDEQTKWDEMDKRDQENLELMEQFVAKSKQETDAMLLDITHKTEESEHKKEAQEAEKLLESIE